MLPKIKDKKLDWSGTGEGKRPHKQKLICNDRRCLGKTLEFLTHLNNKVEDSVSAMKYRAKALK